MALYDDIVRELEREMNATTERSSRFLLFAKWDKSWWEAIGYCTECPTFVSTCTFHTSCRVLINKLRDSLLEIKE